MAIIRKEDVKCTICVILFFFFFFFLVEVGERRGEAERERERNDKNNLLRKCPGSKGKDLFVFT